MSVIPSLSWVSPGTADYITRQEVIDFASSVVQYISAGGLSSINFNVGANPNFSTINMNPTGSVNMNGCALVNANPVGVSSMGFIQAKPITSVQNAFSFTAIDNSSLEPVQAQTIACKDVVGSVNIQGWYANKTGLIGATNGTWNGLGTPGLTWLGSNGGNQWTLENISTINGTPPGTSGTTFTTLTGTTLNAQNVNSANVNNVSTLNGSQVIAPLDTTYNITTITGLANETFTTIGTINTPFNIPANSAVLASVNVSIGSFAPGSPTIFYGQFGLRIGGQGAGGGAFFPICMAFPTALANTQTTFTITGVFQTPTASATNTIEILAYNLSGTAVTCQIKNPTSPANIVYAKVLY